MVEKKKPKFLRRVTNRYSKLGKRRKKKQKWRAPTGRDNKMRLKEKGYPAIVSIGYGTKKSDRVEIFVVNNINDFDRIKEGQRIVLGNVGKKKKIELLKKAQEKKVEFYRADIEKELKKLEKPVKKEKKVKVEKKDSNNVKVKEEKKE